MIARQHGPICWASRSDFGNKFFQHCQNVPGVHPSLEKEREVIKVIVFVSRIWLRWDRLVNVSSVGTHMALKKLGKQVYDRLLGPMSLKELEDIMHEFVKYLLDLNVIGLVVDMETL